MGTGASGKPGGRTCHLPVFLPNPAQASPTCAPHPLQSEGILLLVTKLHMRDGRGRIGVCLPSCNLGLVLEDKHVSSF